MFPTDATGAAALEQRERLAAGRASPAAFYVTGEDALQLTALNSVTNARVVLSGRFLDMNGRVQAFRHELLPTSDRIASSIVRPLGEGWILDLNVYASSATTQIGQCWARVQVIRGLAASGVVLGTLVSGYITATQPIAFPGGRVRGTLDTAGVLRSIAGTDPAAGVDFSEVVPTGARWRLLAFIISLATGVDVGNRSPQLVFDNGTTSFFISDPPATQAASVSFDWAFGEGTHRLASTRSTHSWNVPTTILLMAGWRFRAVNRDGFAADNWNTPQYVVEEWLEGA